MKRTRTISLWRSLGFGHGRQPPAGRAERRRTDHTPEERPIEDHHTLREERPRAHPRQVRRPGERPYPPASPLRGIVRRRRAQISMDFIAGVASGAGLLLALAGAVFVLFPQAWPQPPAVARGELAAAGPDAAALPAAVAPPPQQVLTAQPRTASGRADAMPMTAVIAAPPPAPPAVINTTGAASDSQPAGDDPPAIEQVSLAGAHAIYLSSFPDQELAESGWQILERRYGKALKGLKPQIVEGRGNGGKRVWRLFAGPLGSAADAAQRCRALAFGSVNCKPADFTGGATGASGAWEG